MIEHAVLQEQVEFADLSPLRLLQITDTHLMAEPGGTLLNVDTDASLEAVVRRASDLPAAQALLITGDIAGDGGSGAYDRLDRALQPLGAPSFWLPGNHDDAQQVRDQWAHRFKRRLRCAAWDVLLLDTHTAGEVGGHLDDTELQWLASAVEEVNAASRHLLVALHHPLVSLDCAWLDEQRVSNGEQALAILEKCEGTALVVSGHVHQDTRRRHRSVELLTTPSTCVQFAPESDDFLADSRNPGLRELVLYADGRFETQVFRVEDETFPIDLDSGGYL